MREKGDGDNGREGIPDLLTQEEAIRLLRLDEVGLKRPKESLRYLRRTGQIGYVKVAGKVLIPREEVAAYIRRHANLTDSAVD